MCSLLVKTSLFNITLNLLQDSLAEARSRPFSNKGVVAPLLLGGVSLMMAVALGWLTLSFIHPVAVFSSWCAEHKGTRSSFAGLCDAASPNLGVTYWWLLGMVLLYSYCVLCFSALEILFPWMQGFRSCMS